MHTSSSGAVVVPAGDLAQWKQLQAPLVELVRCLECRARVEITELRPGDASLGPDGTLTCTACGQRYPIRGGTLRMVRAGDVEAVKDETAQSFAYEWEHFGHLRDEWEQNFRDYMRPHDPASLRGRLVLDVGCGSGRHSHHAAAHGARVVAVDLGDSIDVARRNLPPDVLTIQADAEQLPFADGTFDIVMSIGVLHHLPDPERAFRGIVPFARTGGHVHVYLYWQPPVRWHRTILQGVTAARRVTVRMPHRLLHLLCYPLAAVLFAIAVLPYRALRGRPRGRRLAAALPLKTYADYPFGVCVNDQFDRLSAPLERRFERVEVERLLEEAGLEDVVVLPNHGWVADGRRPA